MSLSTRSAAAPMVTAIWIGLILGVSFYAASIKFTAPGVGLEQLLAIGKVTFQGFTWIELGAFALLLFTLRNQFTRSTAIYISALCLLLLVQKFVILPIIDTRLDQAVAGELSNDSILHFVYGAIDVVKLMALFMLSRLLYIGDDVKQTPDTLA